MLKKFVIYLMIISNLAFSESNVNKEEINQKESSLQENKVLAIGLMAGGLVLTLVGLSSANGEKVYNPQNGTYETKINEGGAVMMVGGMLAALTGALMLKSRN